MVKKKGQSKRSTLKDKYRIQRRVAETHRKRKKEDKKDIAAGRKVVKPKDPGIPNSWPFKQDLLKDIARTRERTQEQVAVKKEQRQQDLRQLHQHQQSGGTARTIVELMERAQNDNDNFTQKQLVEEGEEDTIDGNGGATATKSSSTSSSKTRNSNSNNDSGQQSRRAYLRELKKVIDQSDVILQVLDARDPISTRMNRSQEDAILSHVHKRMVLCLNKIDLVPKHVVSEWLSHLRKSHPTIAIKASSGGVVNSTSTSTTRKAAAADDDETETAVSSTPLGMDGLLQLLKNYARTTGVGSNKKQNKSTIVVGIVGYPNTGKSSIINALKRCRAVGVSARAGFTTCLQEVVLDTNVRLIDSPGVVFDDSSTMLANCVDTESMDDPIAPIVALLQRANHNSLLLTYNIPTFYPPTNVDLFLGLVAKSHGRVLKGGIPDKKAAARSVLRDWNSGKIPYYTVPPSPSEPASSDTTNSAAVIVQAFGPEFDLSKYDQDVLDTAANTIDEMDCVQLDSEIPPVKMSNDEDDNDDDMDEEEEEDDDDDEDDGGNYDFNSMMK